MRTFCANGYASAAPRKSPGNVRLPRPACGAKQRSPVIARLAAMCAARALLWANASPAEGGVAVPKLISSGVYPSCEPEHSRSLRVQVQQPCNCEGFGISCVCVRPRRRRPCAMLATMTGRRSYDHRMRDLVCEGRDPGLFKHLGVPRSTSASWTRRGPRPSSPPRSSPWTMRNCKPTPSRLLHITAICSDPPSAQDSSQLPPRKASSRS
jgi:hypothetical protein